MSALHLFIDGSVNPQSKVGYGAYLALSSTELSQGPFEPLIKLNRFENTSSAKLELQTLLWALDELGEARDGIHVYTDSQNIIRLLARRDRLEKSGFLNAAKKPLANQELYVRFYQYIDRADLRFTQVKGHTRKDQKSAIDSLFATVDRATRRALQNR